MAGAGALGLSTALALADAGCAVTVFDPATPLANASGVAAGMIAPAFEVVLDPEAAAHFPLLMAARDLWPALEARAGVRLDRAGAVAVGAPAWLADVGAGLTRLGLHAADLPRNVLDEIAPGLGSDLERGFWMREDWRLDPAQAVAALRRACTGAGVVFRAEPARGLEGADRLVIATGPSRSLAALAPELAVLTPIKGHILRIATAERPAMVMRGEGVYALAAEGGLTVGATMEAGVADPTPDPAAGPPLLAAGARLFPTLARAPFELAAGVRAATPDGLPLVGPGATPNVILATGARRNGWLLAPLVAQVVTACVTGREAGPYAARLAPGRFV
ncbi:FAD-binding oxidoreductase [Phenylobacterium sp. J367]|uniref:NAD(P)/FAD-dependent oxidoreductase n=1 Tax=Phenylobacterium sp. J367 TaxID=2898435 RepID=UPI002151DC2A|nr:FAD-dependent oxidoreductase [Phenylobacterium sp. J367]MCR5880844.1 FAD-binding oxidoreductase [Phenylobacterium sp. J367]